MPMQEDKDRATLTALCHSLAGEGLIPAAASKKYTKMYLCLWLCCPLVCGSLGMGCSPVRSDLVQSRPLAQGSERPGSGLAPELGKRGHYLPWHAPVYSLGLCSEEFHAQFPGLSPASNAQRSSTSTPTNYEANPASLFAKHTDLPGAWEAPGRADSLTA